MEWGIELVEETPQEQPRTLDTAKAKEANLDDLMNQLNNL